MLLSLPIAIKWQKCVVENLKIIVVFFYYCDDNVLIQIITLLTVRSACVINVLIGIHGMSQFYIMCIPLLILRPFLRSASVRASHQVLRAQVPHPVADVIFSSAICINKAFPVRNAYTNANNNDIPLGS